MPLFTEEIKFLVMTVKPTLSANSSVNLNYF